jgi:hypothetical protein
MCFLCCVKKGCLINLARYISRTERIEPNIGELTSLTILKNLYRTCIPLSREFRGTAQKSRLEKLCLVIMGQNAFICNLLTSVGYLQTVVSNSGYGLSQPIVSLHSYIPVVFQVDHP